MQISGESHVDNVYVLLGLLLKNGGLQKKLYVGPLFGILDISERICKFPVKFSLIMYIFYWGFC